MPKSGDKQPNVPIKAHIWQLIAIFPVSSLHFASSTKVERSPDWNDVSMFPIVPINGFLSQLKSPHRCDSSAFPIRLSHQHCHPSFASALLQNLAKHLSFVLPIVELHILK
jgi:hypothetical protein